MKINPFDAQEWEIIIEEYAMSCKDYRDEMQQQIEERVRFYNDILDEMKRIDDER